MRDDRVEINDPICHHSRGNTGATKEKDPSTLL